MNSRHLKQASIPFLAVLAIWWWTGGDEPVHDVPDRQDGTAQRTETLVPRHDRIPGYYAANTQVATVGSQDRTNDYTRAQGPAQQYWAPEQTHLGPYRFRPLSEREKRRLYSTAPVYSTPELRDFQPGSYARAVPDPIRQAPGHYAPRWNVPYASGNYNYRPTDRNRAQASRWRPGSDRPARWSSPYQQDPERWSGPGDRRTAEYPSWQSPAERMLPSAEIGLDPTLTSLY